MKFWYHYHEERRRVGWRERRAGGSHSVPVARSQFTKCINHFILCPSSPPIWGFRALVWRTPPQFVAQIWKKKAISAIGLHNYINRISKEFSLFDGQKGRRRVSLPLVSIIVWSCWRRLCTVALKCKKTANILTSIGSRTLLLITLPICWVFNL